MVGLSSAIQHVFDKMKTDYAAKHIAGSVSVTMKLDCELLVRQQLEAMFLDLFEKNDPNKVLFIVTEDSEAVINICDKGRSGAPRHCHRTHKFATDWLLAIF